MVALEQLAVFFQGGSATRGVGDDRVESAVQTRVDVAAGEAAREFAEARVHVQSSAAGLSGGNRDFAAIVLEHADRGLIQTRETDVGDTSGQKRHAILSLADGGKHTAELREERWRFHARCERSKLTQPSAELDSGGLLQA